jgi:hypothetical protein
MACRPSRRRRERRDRTRASAPRLPLGRRPDLPAERPAAVPRAGLPSGARLPGPSCTSGLLGSEHGYEGAWSPQMGARRRGPRRWPRGSAVAADGREAARSPQMALPERSPRSWSRWGLRPHTPGALGPKPSAHSLAPVARNRTRLNRYQNHYGSRAALSAAAGPETLTTCKRLDRHPWRGSVRSQPAREARAANSSGLGNLLLRKPTQPPRRRW